MCLLAKSRTYNSLQVVFHFYDALHDTFHDAFHDTFSPEFLDVLFTFQLSGINEPLGLHLGLDLHWVLLQLLEENLQ